jgi:hypothetical protein
MVADKIFCDACLRGRTARYAVVCGNKVDVRTVAAEAHDINRYEKLAVQWAKILYPRHDHKLIFTDSQNAAATEGVSWIPRRQNGRANSACRITRIEAGLPQGPARPRKQTVLGAYLRKKKSHPVAPSRFIELGGWSLD